VFFGLYGLPDFYALWRHKGKRAILWAGSDIIHFIKGYWLEDGGKIKIDCKPLAKWIDKYCDSYVENEIEYKALKKVGIASRVIPSFLGDVNKFDISYKWKERPSVYTSVSGNDFKVYGWDKVIELAKKNPEIDFFLYGNTIPFNGYHENVIVRGRLPKAKMNREIKDMQGALRMTEFDGASEIIVKAMLMGQWPVSLIKYPHTLRPEEMGKLLKLKKPNVIGRNSYIKKLNKFPWQMKR